MTPAEAIRAWMKRFHADRERLLEYAVELATRNHAPVCVYAPGVLPGHISEWLIPAGVAE